MTATASLAFRTCSNYFLARYRIALFAFGLAHETGQIFDVRNAQAAAFAVQETDRAEPAQFARHGFPVSTHAMGNVVDMRRFGGLRKVLPHTHWTFLCGAYARVARRTWLLGRIPDPSLRSWLAGLPPAEGEGTIDRA